MGWYHNTLDKPIVRAVADFVDTTHTPLSAPLLYEQLVETHGHHCITSAGLKLRLKKLRSLGLLRYCGSDTAGWLPDPNGNAYFRSALQHLVEECPMPTWIGYPLNVQDRAHLAAWCDDKVYPTWASPMAIIEAAALLSQNAIDRGLKIES